MNIGNEKAKPKEAKPKEEAEDFDDRPIKPALSNNFVNIDDMPVGVHKRSAVVKESTDDQKVSFGGIIVKPSSQVREQEDMDAINPFKASKINSEKQSSNVKSEEEMPIGAKAQPPQYDFDKMIEEAMLNDKDAPAVHALNSNNQKARKDASDNEGDGKSAKKLDPKKQALLEKRKKYDPRAAIKNSKKSEHKVANSVSSPAFEQVAAESRLHVRDKSSVS